MQVATTRMGRTRAVSMQKINVLLFRLEQVLSIDYTYSIGHSLTQTLGLRIT